MFPRAKPLAFIHIRTMCLDMAQTQEAPGIVEAVAIQCLVCGVEFAWTPKMGQLKFCNVCMSFTATVSVFGFEIMVFVVVRYAGTLKLWLNLMDFFETPCGKIFRNYQVKNSRSRQWLDIVRPRTVFLCI